MSGTSRVVFIACLFICFSQVHCGCNDTVPYPTATILETDGPIGILSKIFGLYAVGYDVYFNVTAVRDPSQDFTSNFTIHNDRYGHRLSLMTLIMLDYFVSYARNEAGDLELKVMFKCVHRATRRVEYAVRYILVKAVDSYAPRLYWAVKFTVREDAPVNSKVASIMDRLYDADIPKDYTNLTMQIYGTYSDTFDINNQGDIFLRKKLDYELGARVMILGIRITNAVGVQSSSIVTIYVTDANEEFVRFVYGGCKEDCDHMHYTAHVPITTRSRVVSRIDNGPIYADDASADFIGYTLIGANWKNFHKFFTIGYETGNLSVVGKFTKVKAPRPYLIVRAQSFSSRVPDKTTAQTLTYSMIFLVTDDSRSDL